MEQLAIWRLMERYVLIYYASQYVNKIIVLISSILSYVCIVVGGFEFKI